MYEPAAFIRKLLNWLLKYSVAAILVFIPLYPKFPLFFLPQSTVAVRAEDFLIFFATSILMLNLIVKNVPAKPPLFFQVFIFIIIGFLSSFSAILITQNVFPLTVFLHFFRRLEYLIVFYLVYYVGVSSLNRRRFLLEMVLLPPIGVFLYGLAQIYLDAPVISTMNSEFSKGLALRLQPGVQLSSTFAGHYDLAIYLAMILAFVSSAFCFAKKITIKLLLLLSFITLLWLFMQAGSRIGLIGLLISTAIIPLLYRSWKSSILLTFIVFLSIGFSPYLINRLGNILKVFQSKLQSTIVRPVYAEELRPIQQDRSTSIRFDVEWPKALRSFSKNPFWGTGYSSLGLATDNDYLRALGETGLIGFLAFLAILMAFAKGLLNRLKLKLTSIDNLITKAGVGVFIVFTISAIFLDVFAASKIAIMFYAFMGLVFSVPIKVSSKK